MENDQVCLLEDYNQDTSFVFMFLYWFHIKP